MLDAGFGVGIRRELFERIERRVLRAWPVRVVADRAERSRDDDARGARFERGAKQVARSDDVAVEDLPLVARGGGELRRAMMNAVAAVGGGRDRWIVPQVAINALDRLRERFDIRLFEANAAIGGNVITADTCFVSGLAAARQLGAEYPFDDSEAARWFNFYGGLMYGRRFKKVRCD